MMRTQIGDLEHNLAVMQQKLSASEDTSDHLKTDVNSLTARNQFLENHMMALEREVQEYRQQTSNLKRKVGELESEQKAEKKKKVVGRKNFCELGSSSKALTKTAFKENVAENVNALGANRGLVFDQLVMRAEDGRKVTISANKPKPYGELDAEEKQKVITASAWKDRRRIPDESYAELGKVGTFPCASHVKSYEAELNQQIGTPEPVNGW